MMPFSYSQSRFFGRRASCTGSWVATLFRGRGRRLLQFNDGSIATEANTLGSGACYSVRFRAVALAPWRNRLS